VSRHTLHGASEPVAEAAGGVSGHRRHGPWVVIRAGSLGGGADHLAV